MYNHKKHQEPVPEQMTKVWECATDGCNSWMRDNFAFDHEPNCMVCSAVMKSGERMLPVLDNPNSIKA